MEIIYVKKKLKKRYAKMEYKHYLKNYFKILVDDILKYSTLAIAEKR